MKLYTGVVLTMVLALACVGCPPPTGQPGGTESRPDNTGTAVIPLDPDASVLQNFYNVDSHALATMQLYRKKVKRGSVEEKTLIKSLNVLAQERQKGRRIVVSCRDQDETCVVNNGLPGVTEQLGVLTARLTTRLLAITGE